MINKNKEVLKELKTCAKSWEPEARLLGNIRACDIVMAVDSALENINRMESTLKDIIETERHCLIPQIDEGKARELIHFKEDSVLIIDCLYGLGKGSGQTQKDKDLPSIYEEKP